MGMSHMKMKKGNMGKTSGGSSECCHTMQSKAAPGMPSVKTGDTSWPSEGMNVGLKTDKQAGKNRGRTGFKPGSQW